MLKKIILAGATSSVLAVTGLAVMTSGVAAAAPGYQPNNNQTWNQPYPHRDDDCRPFVRSVKWYDRFGFVHWRRIVIADRCDFRGPHPDWN